MTAAPTAVMARARHLVDAPPAWSEPPADALALAWALKDLCYESWGSDPHRAVRAAQTLRTLFEAGGAADQVSEIGALADWTEGIALTTRGQMGEAVHHFDRAQASFLAIGKPDPAAQTQVPKIMALSMLGQHDRAAECAVTTQQTLVELGNLASASRVSLNLGGLHLRRDNYAESTRHYREAAVLFARIGDHEQSVLADIGMADSLAALGDFEEALHIYARARLRAAHRGLEVPLALADESAALVELARGRYREALAGFEAARRRYESLALPQHLAIAEKQLGDVYLELRLLPEALGLFETAIAKFRSLELPDEQAWALAQQGRAEALLRKGTADASFAEAARLFIAHGNAVGQATVALARAELALQENDPQSALELAECAVGGFTAAAQTDGRSRADVVRAHCLVRTDRLDEASRVFEAALERARELQQGAIQVRCLTGRGLVAQAAGDEPAAASAFDAAIDLFEEQRRALPGDDMRSAFLTEHLRPYQERLRMALASGVAGDTLLQLDRFRARSLEESVSAGSPQEAHDEDARALRARLNWLYRRASQSREQGSESAALNDERLRIERSLLELTRRQRLIAPERTGGNTTELSIAALQHELIEGDALVEYGVLDGELFACVVTAQEVTLVRHLARWLDVLEALHSVRFQIDALRNGAAPLRQHLPTLQARAHVRMTALHGLLWAPLAAALQGCRRVLVVPHAQLGAVPFAALSDARGTLGERLELAVAPSARMALRGLRRPPARPRQAVALGESSRLPHTAREAEFVAGLFEHGLALVGSQATLQALEAQVGDADVVHLACHAQFRNDNPRFSALHLHDDALTAERAELLRLKPCTVVLSACETGLNEFGSGDEMVGLVRAFIVAGAARVVASLWPVEDEVTVGFMTHFYGALVQGQGAAAALQSAQAATARDHPHPYFWAAFALYGGW